MGRTGWLIAGGATVLIGLAILTFSDQERTGVLLGHAKTVRAVADLALPGDVDSFLGKHRLVSETSPTEDAIKESLKAAAAPQPLPIAFGSKSRATDLSIASAAYAQLVLNRRGTWLTYQNEVAAARSKLDASIIAVEQSSSAGKVARSDDFAKDALKTLQAKLHAIDVAEEEKIAATQAAETKRLAAQHGITAEALDPYRSPSRDDVYSTDTSTPRAPIRIERPTPVPEPFGQSTRPTPAIGGAFKKTS